MSGKLTVVPFQAGEKMPDELVQVLEHAVEMAKEGKLESCIFMYNYDEGATAQVAEDGFPLLAGGHFFWRRDGRLDAVHSDCHVLAHHALEDLIG